MANTNWFKESKYGLFIHFGLYSILEGEYKGTVTHNIAEWIMNSLYIPVEEYRDLAKQFNPVNFNADYIVSKAKAWGMKYVVFTSKHHEGFANYKSECSNYNSYNYANRDLVKELKDACDKYNLKFGLYYSQAQDWDDPDGYMQNRDNSKKNYSKYLEEKCYPQLHEIMKYMPDLIWFDTPMDTDANESRKMVEIVKSYNPDVIISGRIGNGLGEYMTTGDNFIPRLPYDGLFEVPATLNDTWGYSKHDHNFKKSEDIIYKLIQIVSRGGNYLLNIGPKADGSIPLESIEILDKVATYVNENKDAIYNTFDAGVYPYDLDYCLFTCKKNHLYAHMFKPKKRIEIINIANKCTGARLLKDNRDLKYYTGMTCEKDHYIEVLLPEEYWDKSYYVVDISYKEDKPIYEEIKW